MNLDLDCRRSADANNGTTATGMQIDVSSNLTDNTGVSPDERDKASGQVGIFHKSAGLRRSCDRCHAQKLKCSGRRVSFSQCLRCQRMGLSCSYSARSARKTAQKNNDLGVGDLAVHKDVRNTQRPELPVLDEIDLASLDMSSTMSFNMAQAGL